MTIDTLSLAKELRAAELPPAHAEAIAAAIGRSINEGSATKSDIDVLDQRLSGKIETMRAELKGEIERARNQIVLWVIGSQVTVAGLAVAVFKALG